MFKIYTRLAEDKNWYSVLDIHKSRSKKVDRIFMSQQEVDSFITVALKNIDQSNIKVEEMTDGEIT